MPYIHMAVAKKNLIPEKANNGIEKIIIKK